MAQKAIREFDAKSFLFKYWSSAPPPFVDTASLHVALVDLDHGAAFNPKKTEAEFPWLEQARLVVKPDQLVKRRGELGLVKLNLSWSEAAAWISEKAHQPITIEGVHDELHTFILEPFCPHASDEEMYVSFQNVREGTLVYFYHQGGVHVGDVDSKARKWVVPVTETLSEATAREKLLGQVVADEAGVAAIAQFVVSLHRFYLEYNFVFLEINPFVLLRKSNTIFVLDAAAKLDSDAQFAMASKWGADFKFASPFGKAEFEQEARIRALDESSGASLKLTVLNIKGRIWTLVAGGGASVVYTDCIANFGGISELANYGEYSGNPSSDQTFQYVQAVLQLMLKHPHEQGKLLIVGGGIANFTDVYETFKGIISAFQNYAKEIRDAKIKILVRRGGPNSAQGLAAMASLKQSHGLDIQVFGVDTTITAIVPVGMKAMQLGNLDRIKPVEIDPSHPALSYSQSGVESGEENEYNLFTRTTVSIIYGIQPVAVQGMLDFDFACHRTRSVCCMVYPFGEMHFRKFYWGTSEILMPVYTSMDEACRNHPEASVLVNFASFRSAFDASIDAMRMPQIRTICIIAEGLPELQTRKLIVECAQKKVRLIGPATVGGLKAGCFKVGNTGGVLDNVIKSKLYRPGSVAYVSKSGGMSNELNNIISRHSDGVYEGIAIGGDRYPGTTFIDHILRYEANPAVKIIVLLGEVGGTDELAVVEALKRGALRKPLVAWCIGTCSEHFSFAVSFGHAGSNINGQLETSKAKNALLKEAGAFVPNDFDGLGNLIEQIFNLLRERAIVSVRDEPPVPVIPMDFDWAAKLGLVRKPANFVTTISDERGEELVYGTIPISKVLSDKMGIGGVISLLWFQRNLPVIITDFIEMVLMVTADHGAAVAGAHNTIVTARAGKDLVSSLCAGLLTIGPRFGGALDDTAKVFRSAFDRGLSAREFVQEMHAKKELIPGIGHRVKSVQNPDSRVTILIDYAKQNFPFPCRMLEFALEVEKITTQKRSNLILNVDGCIACLFTDIVRESGQFDKDEESTFLDSGVLNGLFVLGRSVGFIGHFLDQTRLKQPLYRHPWSDISKIDAPQRSSSRNAL